jgi:hypothetical protein
MIEQRTDVYDTECTCREPDPVEVLYKSMVVVVCKQCGSRRDQDGKRFPPTLPYKLG